MATTVPVRTEPAAARHRFSSPSFVIEASRPGLWATAVWFYLLPLGRRHVFYTSGFWLGLVYVTLPLGLIIYGWNDIADANIDQLNPRKGSFLFGARGSHDQLARLPLKIALAQAIFAALFMLLIGPKILLWFAGLIVFTAIYNFPRYGLKQNPPFDILNQAGYLLVFVLSSWINHEPQLRWPAMLFGALFAMHSHIFGEVMDIVPDRAGGRRTTATVIGAVPSKLLISGMLGLEAILIYINYADRWISGALAFGAFWFVLDALLLWRERPYSLRAMQAFMLGWNTIALGSMGWIWSNAVFVG